MKNSLAGTRVLVTGHTGFKGSWLVHVLSHLGAEVAGYSHEPIQDSHFIKANTVAHLKFHSIGDVRDRERLTKVYREFKPQLVFHLAAQALVSESYLNPNETFTTNILGTLNVLEASNETSVERTIVITTDKVYRDDNDPLPKKENAPLGGWDPYAASKAAADIVAQSWWSLKGKSTKVAIARGGNVLGGGDISVNRIVPDIERALKTDTVLYLRNPSQIRPWQHVLDCLSGYLAIAIAEESLFEDNWNIGPEFSQIGQSVELLARDYLLARGRHLEIAVKNEGMHETNQLLLDPNKAKQVLGWSSKLSAFETLDQTANWNRKVIDDGRNAGEETKRQVEHYFNRFPFDFS